MDFEYHYSDKQQRFRLEVRSWLAENIPADLKRPHSTKYMEKETWYWIRDFRIELGKKGWLHATYPKEYGGGGLTAEENVVIQEELLHQDLPPFYDNTLDLPSIMVWGTEEQKKEYLPPRLRGEHLTWEFFTEPGAGSDLASIRTRAVKEGDEWVITGEKVFVGADAGYGPPGTKVPDEDQVQAIYLLAVTDPNAPRHRNLGWFYIPGIVPGMTVQTLDLLTGQGKRQAYFDGVRVPSTRLVGGETQGWQVSQTTLEIEHGGGGNPVPRGAKVAGLIKDYARESGRGQDRHYAQVAANAFTETEIGRLIGTRNYWMYSNRQEMSYHGSQNSLWGKESGIRVADDIREMAGLECLLDFQDPKAPFNGSLEDQQRESLVRAHPGGTIEVQKVIIARRLGVSRTKERAAATPSTAAAR